MTTMTASFNRCHSIPIRIELTVSFRQAYCGLTQVGHVKPEHTVVISGAAGATGGAAVQIAKKIFGCKRVVGIAGGSEKVRPAKFRCHRDRTRCVAFGNEADFV